MLFKVSIPPFELTHEKPYERRNRDLNVSELICFLTNDVLFYWAQATVAFMGPIPLTGTSQQGYLQ